MNLTEAKRRIIQKLSGSKEPMSRFELMMVVMEPELSILRRAIVEFVDIGDVEITIDWQLRLRKEIREANEG